MLITVHAWLRKYLNTCANECSCMCACMCECISVYLVLCRQVDQSTGHGVGVGALGLGDAKVGKVKLLVVGLVGGHALVAGRRSRLNQIYQNKNTNC